MPRPARLLDDVDGVAGRDRTACQYYRHDGALHDRKTTTLRRHGAPQIFLKALDLDAGRTKAGNLDARAGSKLQDRAGIEPGQMNMPRRDVLAEVSGREAKSERVELKDEFLFHEMDLPCYVITGKVSHVVVPLLELS
jgi:hypothetical protein